MSQNNIQHPDNGTMDNLMLLANLATQRLEEIIEENNRNEDARPQCSYPETIKVTQMKRPNFMPEDIFRHIKPEEITLKYNKNMARQYPEKNRTKEEQAKRDQNTVRARISRAKKRAMEEILIRKLSEQKKRQQYLKNRLAYSFTYASILREKLGKDQTNYVEEYKHVTCIPEPIPTDTDVVGNHSPPDQENGAKSSRRVRKNPNPRKLESSDREP